MTAREMVKEFALRNGSVVEGVNNSEEVAVLRVRLMIEEFAETYVALHENDLVEAVDGLADLLYVIYGAAVAYGVPCRDVFEDPIKPPVESFSSREVVRFGRAVLPKLWRTCDALVMASDYCGAALEDLAAEVCVIAARVWGLPMRELFEEVHRSNMTKTFAPTTIAAGSKYGAVRSKGESYSPPDLLSILKRARESFGEGPMA